MDVGDLLAALTSSALVLPQLLPPTLEDVAPFIAQAGFRHAADLLSQLNRYLRSEERIWRAISRLPLGLHGRTRLAASARVGDVARCSFLVEHGAVVAARDRFGRSPLTEALAGGHVECAVWLRARGAKVDAAWEGVHDATWGPALEPGGAPDSVDALVVCCDGRVAVGHSSGDILLRDAATSAVTAILRGHADSVCALVSLHGSWLASGSWDHTVRLWDVGSGTCKAVLEGHAASVFALVELRDGRLASGSEDGNVRLWDVLTRTCTAVLAHANGVASLAALPNGGVAVGFFDGSIALWSAAGARTATLGGGVDVGGGAGFGAVYSLALLPDGRLVAGHDTPNVIRVWDVEHRALGAVISGHTAFVRVLAALPDGRLLSGSGDCTMKLWDERVLSVRGGAAADACAATLAGHAGYPIALAVLPDRRVVSGSGDGTVRAWR